MLRWILTTTMTVALSCSLEAAIRSVPDGYPTIQAAIDAAEPGDEVVVGPGVYNEAINLLGKAITLRSLDGRDVTTIDASGTGESAVLCASGEGFDTVIEGFTITGGSGSAVTGTFRLGGGLFAFISSPTIRDCIFRGNTAHGGGGIQLKSSAARISNCVFLQNSTTGAGDSGGGSGLHTTNGSPVITNCSFIENATIANGGGGGMTNINGSPRLTNCVFRDNWARYGGAIRNNNGGPVITNCTFQGNVAQGVGGAIRSTLLGPSDPLIVNSIFWGNWAPVGPELIDQSGAATRVFNSNVAGGWYGLGADNVSIDPQFVDAGGGNLRLAAGSPCINAGDDDGLPLDANDLDGDGDTDETVPVDLDRRPRQSGTVGPLVDLGAYEFQACAGDLNNDQVVDVTDVFLLLNTWNTDGAGDLNRDGTTDADDLLTLLNGWGSCPPTP